MPSGDESLPPLLPAFTPLKSVLVSGCAAQVEVAGSARVGAHTAVGRGTGITETKLSQESFPPELVATRVNVYVWPWLRIYVVPVAGVGCRVTVKGLRGEELPALIRPRRVVWSMLVVQSPGVAVKVTAPLHLAVGGAPP